MRVGWGAGLRSGRSALAERIDRRLGADEGVVDVGSLDSGWDWRCMEEIQVRGGPRGLLSRAPLLALVMTVERRRVSAVTHACVCRLRVGDATHHGVPTTLIPTTYHLPPTYDL